MRELIDVQRAGVQLPPEPPLNSALLPSDTYNCGVRTSEATGVVDGHIVSRFHYPRKLQWAANGVTSTIANIFKLDYLGSDARSSVREPPIVGSLPARIPLVGQLPLDVFLVGTQSTVEGICRYESSEDTPYSTEPAGAGVSPSCYERHARTLAGWAA